MEEKLTGSEFDFPKFEGQLDDTIISAAIAYDKAIYNSKASDPSKNCIEATKKLCIFFKDGTTVALDFSNDSFEDKKVVLSDWNKKIKSDIEDSSKYKSYYLGDKEFEKQYQKAEKQTRKKSNRKRNATLAVITASILIGAGGVALAAFEKEPNMTEITAALEKNLEMYAESLMQELGRMPSISELSSYIEESYYNIFSRYGRYNLNLSTLNSMAKYEKLVPESEQKTQALKLFNILSTFNDTIKMQDDTMQVSGLTIEQLIAIDAYSNTNIYTKEDYVKLFGLYDFSNITNDFQNGVNVAAAYLANKDVDGTVLADIFKDEKVKESYLKMLEYRDNILGSEKNEQKKYIKELEQYIASTSDKTSDNYMDYSDHPGMAFVASTIVNALNYNNISLSKEIVSKHLIMGTETTPSLINSICDNANRKMEEVQEFIQELNDLIPNPEAVEFATEEYNKLEKENATKEGRKPVPRNAEAIIADRRFEAISKYPELVTLILNKLCDQNQINEVTNKDLSNSNKFVTLEDQEKIMQNAIELCRNIQKSGKTNSNPIAEKLINKGDKVTVTEKQVTLTDSKESVQPNQPAQPSQKEQIELKQPELAEQARDEYNEWFENTKGEELFPYETPEQIQQSEEEMKEQDEQTFTKYYLDVMNWYQEHGNSEEISDAVRVAQAALAPSAFELAKNTGIGRYCDANEPECEGGDEHIDSEFDNIDTNASGETNEEGKNVITPYEDISELVQTPASTVEATQAPVETPAPTVAPTQAPVETAAPETDKTVIISPFDDEVVKPADSTPAPSVDIEGGHISSEFEGIDIGDISTDSVAYNSKTNFSQLSDSEKFNYALQALSDEELAALFAATVGIAPENTNRHRI